MKLIPVEPEDVDNIRRGRRGRISYPIIKMFMESGMPLAKIDREGMGKTVQSMNASLVAYIRSHDMPIKVFTRVGELYLARTDLDDKQANEPVMTLEQEIAARTADV